MNEGYRFKRRSRVVGGRGLYQSERTQRLTVLCWLKPWVRLCARRLDRTGRLSELVRAATTKFHRQEGLNNRHLFS